MLIEIERNIRASNYHIEIWIVKKNVESLINIL